MKTFAALTAGVLLLAVTAMAADKKPAEVTLKGTGTCAKCGLSVTAKCQDAIQVKEGDKEVVYYISDAKGLHPKVCQATVKLEVTGVVSEKEGQKWIKASSFKVVD